MYREHTTALLWSTMTSSWWSLKGCFWPLIPSAILRGFLSPHVLALLMGPPEMLELMASSLYRHKMISEKQGIIAIGTHFPHCSSSSKILCSKSRKHCYPRLLSTKEKDDCGMTRFRQKNDVDRDQGRLSMLSKYLYGDNRLRKLAHQGIKVCLCQLIFVFCSVFKSGRIYLLN